MRTTVKWRCPRKYHVWATKSSVIKIRKQTRRGEWEREKFPFLYVNASLLAASLDVYAIRQVVASTVQLDVTTICTITLTYSSISRSRRKDEIFFLFPHLIIRIYIHIRICHFSNTQKGTRLIEYSSTLYCCCHHHEDKMNSCCLLLLLLLLTSFHAASRNQREKKNQSEIYARFSRHGKDEMVITGVERRSNGWRMKFVRLCLRSKAVIRQTSWSLSLVFSDEWWWWWWSSREPVQRRIALKNIHLELNGWQR